VPSCGTGNGKGLLGGEFGAGSGMEKVRALLAEEHIDIGVYIGELLCRVGTQNKTAAERIALQLIQTVLQQCSNDERVKP